MNPKKQTDHAKGAGISLEPSLVAAAREMAKERGLTLSGLVRVLLIDDLKRNAVVAEDSTPYNAKKRGGEGRTARHAPSSKRC